MHRYNQSLSMVLFTYSTGNRICRNTITEATKQPTKEEKKCIANVRIFFFSISTLKMHLFYLPINLTKS